MNARTPPPAPRRFRFGAVDAVAKFLLLFGGIWAAVGSFIGVTFTVTGGPIWNDLILDRHHASAPATPIAVERTQVHMNRRYAYQISYAFVDQRGVAHTGSGYTTDFDRMLRARRHESMTVEFDPRRPALSRIAGEHASLLGPMILLPVGFTVVGSLIFALGFRRLLRVRAIYVHGEAVRAAVTAVSATLMRINGRRVTRMAYAFDTIMGPATGQTTTVTQALPGDQIWVFYLSSDPSRNVAA